MAKHQLLKVPLVQSNSILTACFLRCAQCEPFPAAKTLAAIVAKMPWAVNVVILVVLTGFPSKRLLRELIIDRTGENYCTTWTHVQCMCAQ